MNNVIAGVDEVGRGSLVGPVFAATVIFKKDVDKKKFKDSKLLSKVKRENLEKYIKNNCIWTIGSASLKEIEKLNILNASMLAMKRSIKKLKIKPSLILIDGNKSPHLIGYNLKCIIKGDKKIPEISAASIIAKVARDRLITKMSKKFTKYAWDKRFEMDSSAPSIEEGLKEAVSIREKPVVLMDSGDNIGAGSSADSTHILHKAREIGVSGILQTLYDPESVKKCINNDLQEPVFKIKQQKQENFVCYFLDYLNLRQH